MGDYRVQLRLPGPSDRSIQVQVYFDGLRRLHGRDALLLSMRDTNVHRRRATVMGLLDKFQKAVQDRTTFPVRATLSDNDA